MRHTWIGKLFSTKRLTATRTKTPLKLSVEMLEDRTMPSVALQQPANLNFSVVDVVPLALSAETNNDTEPSIAANPSANQNANNRVVAITTFSRISGALFHNPNGTAPWSANEDAPVWVSNNNGQDWSNAGRVRPARLSAKSSRAPAAR